MGLLIVQLVTMKLMTCAKVSTISCENACSYDQSLPLVIFFFFFVDLFVLFKRPPCRVANKVTGTNN